MMTNNQVDCKWMTGCFQRIKAALPCMFSTGAGGRKCVWGVSETGEDQAACCILSIVPEKLTKEITSSFRPVLKHTSFNGF